MIMKTIHEVILETAKARAERYKFFVALSHTGKLHCGSPGGTQSACNGSTGRVRKTSKRNVELSEESEFCKKCFQGGKEEALIYAENNE